MDTLKEKVQGLGAGKGRRVIAGAPEGFDALLIAAIAAGGGDVLVVARDDVSMARKSDAMAFFAPETERLEFPAWDCLPYDRVSPRAELVSRRIDTLTRLLEAPEKGGGRVILTTVFDHPSRRASVSRMANRSKSANGESRRCPGMGSVLDFTPNQVTRTPWLDRCDWNIPARSTT